MSAKNLSPGGSGEILPNLRFLRCVSSTTLDEASRRVGVSAATLSRWETGRFIPSDMGHVLSLVCWYAQRAERSAETARMISNPYLERQGQSNERAASRQEMKPDCSAEDMNPGGKLVATSVEPIAIVKRGKAGRPITEDARGAEVKRTLAEWRLTPPHLRELQTIAALARKLGVSRSLLNYYDKRTPQSPQDFIEACERNALGKYYPEALDAMGRKAKENVEAFKAFVKAVVEPRRPQIATISSMYADSALNKKIRDLFQPNDNGTEKTLSIKVEKNTLQIEAKPVEGSGETTNSVQLPAHVESTTYEKQRVLP